jgi:hypothetical protein
LDRVGGGFKVLRGYIELNFAAFAMLGRRFCPRIMDVKHQHIYRIDATLRAGLHLYRDGLVRRLHGVLFYLLTG